MKKSILVVIAVLGFSCATVPAAVLFQNNNLITGTGNGLSGANTSAVATGSSSLGSNANGTGTPQVFLADDFSLSTASQVSSVTVYDYSTSTYPDPPSASPFTGVTLNIWNAQPGTAGAVVLATTTTIASSVWTGIYRVNQATLTNAQRPVFATQLTFPSLTLAVGTYWTSYTLTGIVSPGVATSGLNPPVMNADGTLPVGNGIQSTNGGTTWVAVTDATSGIAEGFPLLVQGNAVPEPATSASLCLGALLGVVALRRRACRV